MLKARYYKSDGKKGRARALPASVFDGVVNESVLHEAVEFHLANRRQGTAAAKNRAAVRGGSHKPWRQKGTGRARQGTIRAAQWAGGGRAFPPIPHSWRRGLNRKVRALARRSALNARALEERVVIVDGLSFEKPKTKQLRQYLEKIELGALKILLLTHGNKQEVHLSARNLPNALTRPFGEESAYDLLWSDVVVIEREALETERQTKGSSETATPADASTGDEPTTREEKGDA